MNHTPGKWEAKENKGVVLGADKPKYVIECGVFWVALADTEADAQFIASAPKNYEKLQELQTLLMRLYIEAGRKPDNEYQIYKRIYTELDTILNDRTKTDGK